MQKHLSGQEKLDIIDKLYLVATQKTAFSKKKKTVVYNNLNYNNLYNQYKEFLQDNKTSDEIKQAFDLLSQNEDDTSVSFADKLIYGIYCSIKNSDINTQHSECQKYLQAEISNIIKANENELKINELSPTVQEHFMNALFEKYCREKKAEKTVSLTEGQYKTFADGGYIFDSFVKNKLKDKNHKDFEECKIMLNLLVETDKDTIIKILKSSLECINDNQSNKYTMVNKLVQNVLDKHNLNPKTILSDIENGNLTLGQKFLNLFLKLIGRDQYTKSNNKTKATQSFVAKINKSKSSVQQCR